MEKSTHQETFLTSAQLFERAAFRCREAETGLRNKLQVLNESKRMEMTSIADQEQLLASALEGYAQHGPQKVLNTRVQYQLESGLDRKIQSHTLDEAYHQLTRLNKNLMNTFHDQALKCGSPSVSEAMKNISTEIDAVNRRISMIRVTAQDL